MSNTQLLINQLQDVSTRGSLSTAYKCAGYVRGTHIFDHTSLGFRQVVIVLELAISTQAKAITSNG